MDIGSTHPIYKCRCLTKLTQAGLNTSLALCFFQKLEKKYQEKITKKQKMGCWSAENATKAFLKTMNMVSTIMNLSYLQSDIQFK